MNDEIIFVIKHINELVWGGPVLILMLAGGIFLSCKTGFSQVHILSLFRDTIFTLIYKDHKSSDGISQRQGFATALAATVGTGSVVGVACALYQGGAGAIFWMWVSAFIGMGLSYCENYLSVKFSQESKVCGAMAYLEKIGKTKLLAILYAVFSVLSSLGMGNMTQTGAVITSASQGFSIPPALTVTVLLIFTAVMVSKNKRSARLCEKLVPPAALIFIVTNLFILIFRPVQTASALGEIFTTAFSLKACAGGTLGALITNVCIQGLKRGAFSNEAGLGSTCSVHSSCNIKDSSLQGKWAMTEVFIDTMIICTLTALCILVSSADFRHISDGSQLVLKAYTICLGSAGKYFTALCLILFALCTLIGWYFIGEQAFLYLFPKSNTIYRLLYIAAVFAGSCQSFELVWGISDIFNGLMAIPNLTGVLILSKYIKKPKFHHLRDE